MSEIMFEVIALGFQGIVVFIFDFPVCSSSLCKMNNIGSSNRVIGHEAVLVLV